MRYVIYGFFIILLLSAGHRNLIAQPAGRELPDGGSGEGFVLVTDRGHYISGETIWFTLFRKGPGDTVSTIIYVEMVAPDGSLLSGSKVPLKRQGAGGKLTIPPEISTGVYYLRYYTRWMRNGGPGRYGYTPVRVYNPFSERMLPVDTLTAMPGKERIAVFRSTEKLACQLEADSFPARGEVHARITWNDPAAGAVFSAAVTRKGMEGNELVIPGICEPDAGGPTYHIPETRGVSLTGSVVDAGTGSPVSYATIYLSVLGEEQDFYSNYSDQAGRFYFAFPDYTGRRELFISADHQEYPELELRIDRDFSSDMIPMPSPPPELDDSMLHLVTGLSVQAQVNSQYYPGGSGMEAGDTDRVVSRGGLLFYGNPSGVIEFDDFIRLPRLEEYFTEVIPRVALRRSRGEPRLVVLGENPDLELYPPLVMIDGVAIFDMNAILEVSPGLVDRVEIVNAPYIRGNVTFGGIISIITRNGDLGYIDLPSSGLLVNYQMADPFVPVPASGALVDCLMAGREVPAPGSGTPAEDHLPDLRNTLCWEPIIEMAPVDEHTLSFTTSDVPGDYLLLIRGLDSRGGYVAARIPFTVY